MSQNSMIAHFVNPTERSKDVILSEAVTFDELLLSKEVLSGLQKSGFHIPSPIQLKAIPLGRCGLDLIVQAKSGTGKTCVFSVIALDAVNVSSSSLQVLVLAPTREIALQIHGVISCIGRNMNGLSVQAFIGGTLVSEDRIKAKKCQIAIGSPGRLKQLIELGVLETRNVRIFVLDEADKLVEEGSFQKQINWIYSTLPLNKQMLALSATYPEELAEFLRRYMREPTYVRLDASHLSLLGLRQYYRVIQECSLPHLIFEEKTKEVMQLLSNVSFQQALVFSNYHSRAESVSEALCSNGWPSTFISGNMDQSRRIEAINKLKQFKCRVLISTDLTSRGIDAQNVDLVINMDVAYDWETYLHRIGRAGRYGSRGIAVSLVTVGEEEQKLLTIATECNATILPLTNITDLRDFTKSNKPPKKLVNLEDVEANPSKHVVSEEEEQEISKDSDEDFSSGSSCDSKTSKSRDLADESRGTADLSRDQPAKTDQEKNCLAVDWGRFNERDFLVKFVNSADPPLIPSVKELQSKCNHLKNNKHYLTMTYKDLKADFSHFVKTGKFADPPAKTPNLQTLESTFAKLSTNKENISNGVKSSEVDISLTQASLNDSYNSSMKVKTPFARNSVSNVDKLQTNVDKAKAVVNEPQRNIVKPKDSTNKFKTDVTVVNDPKNEKRFVKSNVQWKSKAPVKVIRQRHPNCAAAAFDSLKHWTEVEIENSKFPNAPDLLEKAESNEVYEAELNLGAHIVSDFSSEDTDTDSSEYTSDAGSSESDYEDGTALSLESDEYSEPEDHDSPEFTDAHSDFCDEYQSRSIIPPPPVMLQFGPSGHCFNPFLCSHAATQDLTEAFVSHQIYHQALQHARQEVFRYFSANDD